jgi:hypothetical protein
MPEPLARLYDLALRSLEEQERRASELRSRLAPVIAAGGLGTTLLAGPVFRAGHRHGWIELMATAVALLGLLGALGGAAFLLRGRIFTEELDPEESMERLARTGALHDADDFYASIIAALSSRRASAQEAVQRLETAFTVTLCGILVELCGFAAAAIVG